MATGSGTYQQSGPSAPQTARAVLKALPGQTKGYGDVPARLVTNFAAANSNLVFQARAAGSGGEAITVAFVATGTNSPLTIGVVGNAITVNVATDASGAPSSRAFEVRDAVNTNTAASALVAVAIAAGTGGGIVGTMAATPLAGDRSATIGVASNSAPLPTQHPTRNSYN